MIKVENLSKNYGEVQAVKSINFELNGYQNHLELNIYSNLKPGLLVSITFS